MGDGLSSPDRLHVAVGVLVDRLGLDALGGFRWIVDEAHRTGEDIGSVITRVLRDHDRIDPGRTG